MVWILLGVLFAAVGVLLMYWGHANSMGLFILGIVFLVIAVIIVLYGVNGNTTEALAWRASILRS